MVKLLLEHGATVHLDQALHKAIRRSDMQSVEAILRAGASLTRAFRTSASLVYEETALAVAASTGRLKMLEFILNRLATHYHIALLEIFINADVFVAAALGVSHKCIRRLHKICSVQMEPNFLGFTPLHAAAWVGHYRAFELLLDLDCKSPSHSSYFSPLHMAAAMGRTKMVQQLIDRGCADLDRVGVRPPKWITHLIPSPTLLLGIVGRTPYEFIMHILTNSDTFYMPGYCDDLPSCAALLLKASTKLKGERRWMLLIWTIQAPTCCRLSWNLVAVQMSSETG